VQVVAAARDTVRRAVLVIGEPGMRPGRVAALIHYASKARKGALAAAPTCGVAGTPPTLQIAPAPAATSIVPAQTL
jgi:transcriptional regulator with AAA-type ATPase domain